MDGRAALGVKRSHVIDFPTTPSAFSGLGVGRVLLYDFPESAVTGLASSRKSMRYRVYPHVSPLIGPADGFIAGLVKEEGAPVAGKIVRAHDRVTGQVAGQAVSQSSGFFRIEGLDRDTSNYYVVAFNDSPGKDFNAIVYDRIDPISDPAYDLDNASKTILGDSPLAYWKSMMPFLKDGIYQDYGSLRKDITINSQNFPYSYQAWSDAAYSLRRMGRLMQQGCFIPIPDLLYGRLEQGWTVEIFVRFEQASNNENLFEAISTYSAGPTLTAHASTVRLGRVGTSNDAVVEVYSDNTLVSSSSTSGSVALAPGIPTVLSLVYNGANSLKLYQKGSMLLNLEVVLEDVPRQFCSIGKNSMSGSSQFKGVISDIAVFETALNPVQLQAHSDLL